MEHLEPRYLLAGMADLRVSEVSDEPSETPALVWENPCTTIEIMDATWVPDSNPELEDKNDAPGHGFWTPDGNGYEGPVVEEVRDKCLTSTESPSEPLDVSDPSDVQVMTADVFPGAKLSNGDVGSPDASANPGVIAQPVAVKPVDSETTQSNAGSGFARPAATLPEPVYFSEVNGLSRARWKASAEELPDADALLDVIGSKARLSASAPATVTAGSQSPSLLAESTTTFAATWDASSKDNELARREVFSEVQTWTERDDFLPSTSAALHATFSNQLVDEPVPALSILAPDPDGPPNTIVPVAGGGPVAIEPSPSPLSRVQSWYLLGGIGIWQIIFSSRVKRRKQLGENLQ